MGPTDIARLAQASDPRISPSADTVAFTVTVPDLDRNSNRTTIWTGALAGGIAPAPFAPGEGNQSLPRWAPHGGLLAFVSTAEDRSWRIEVTARQAPWHQSLACVWPDVILELAWSPDGTELAFVARDPAPERYGTPEHRPKPRDVPPRRITHLGSRRDNEGWIIDRPSRLFVVPADGSSAPRCLTPEPGDVSGLTWSPDGSRIAFASARHDGWDLDRAQDLYIVAASGGEPTCVTETVASYSRPAWSPDGGRLAYVRDPTPLDGPRHFRVGVLEVESGRATDLTEMLDRNCAPHASVRGPAWDGEDLLFVAEDSGNIHLFRAREAAAEHIGVELGGDRWIEGWDTRGDALVFVSTDPTQLSEVFVVDGGRERQLTAFTDAFAASVELAAPERFVAVSADGAEVECWAVPPIDERREGGGTGTDRAPVLLNIHGGPFSQYGNRFFDEFQIQAAAGFGVIYCNPRGSSGYAEAWARAIRWPECKTDPGSGWGGVDYDDVMACAEEACRRFAWVDPERVGVLGGSYGGYMTSWIIGHTDRFAAACSERACNNLLALEQLSDLATGFRTSVGPSHLEDPEAYLRQSPVTYVDRMTTPLLILHSDDDLRCPAGQAEELFVALRMLGRTPEYVRFPGESHELSRSGSPRHRIMRAEIILEWFRRHLQDGIASV